MILHFSGIFSRKSLAAATPSMVFTWLWVLILEHQLPTREFFFHWMFSTTYQYIMSNLQYIPFTLSIVSMGQMADGPQLERAFAGATVHDCFKLKVQPTDCHYCASS